MSESPNNLTRFWQELKRRKVIHVITVYASASFVIIELINNVTEPLNLPQGLTTIGIVVLAVGFPFAVVLSWIFDVTPMGVEKTRPSSEITEEEKSATPNSWRIATYISVVVIIGLISFNVITRTNLSENLSSYGKTIAILPIINDSQNEEDEMFIKGTMVSLYHKLCKINDLTVMTLEVVEQFRDTIVPTDEIAKKLGVSHVLSSRMRRYGDQVVISCQLVDQNGKPVWTGQIERDINDIEELYYMESQIAQEVARGINATITLEEQQRIEKVPTFDPMARELCREAKLDFIEYMHSGQPEYLVKSKRLYQSALKYDSVYAEAIAGLGWVYMESNKWGDRSQEDFLDSVKIYVDQALRYDSEGPDTYLLRGYYYFELYEWTKALESLNKSLEYDPNFPVAYVFIANIHKNVYGDKAKAIRNYEEAERRNQGELISSSFYRVLGGTCWRAGFHDMAEENIRKGLAFDNDSGVYFSAMGNVEHDRANFEKSIDYELLGFSKSQYQYFGFIGLWNYIYSERMEEANRLVRQFEEDTLYWDKLWQVEVRGYLAVINGEEEKAQKLFDQFLEEIQIGKSRRPVKVARGDRHIGAALIYSYRGQKDLAYKYLEELADMKNALEASEIRHLEINPMFNTIREEERFQKLLRKLQADYLAEHERVRFYLEETGRL